MLITSSYPDVADGSEAAGSFVADLVQILSTKIPVRVVAPGTDNRIERIHANLDVYRFKAPNTPLSNLQRYSPWGLWQIFTVLAAGKKCTLAAMESGNVVHILALWALPCGYWARLASRLYRVPYSVWTLGSDIWSLGKVPIVRQVLAQVLRGASKCYSDGYQLRQDTQEIANRKVDFLPSTRIIELLRPKALSASPPYRLVFIGRWHVNKGPDLLLQALILLDESTWQRIARVDIYGGGPLQPLLETELKTLTNGRRPVFLAGFLDKMAAQEVLQHADYLLLPSRVESIPVVFSDAMKMHCPVIANPVGDLKALVQDGPVGCVAASATAEAFSKAISIAMQSSPQNYEAALHAMAAKFSLQDSIAPKLIDELGLIVDGTRE